MRNDNNNYVSPEEYEKFFSIQKDNKEKHKNALDRAWKNRDFEIEMYWKRATYFWVFLATTFAGYFALQTVDQTKVVDQRGLDILNIVVICLGVCFSFSWILVNRGSKKWQENWEAHIDMLEDGITGPIYKTVLHKKGYDYSVSKINLYVSYFVFGIWLILFIYQMGNIFTTKKACGDILFCIIIVLLILATIIIVLIFFFLCKKNEEDKVFEFRLRKSKIAEKIERSSMSRWGRKKNWGFLINLHILWKRIKNKINIR